MTDLAKEYKPIIPVMVDSNHFACAVSHEVLLALLNKRYKDKKILTLANIFKVYKSYVAIRSSKGRKGELKTYNYRVLVSDDGYVIGDATSGTAKMNKLSDKVWHVEWHVVTFVELDRERQITLVRSWFACALGRMILKGWLVAIPILDLKEIKKLN